MSVTSAVDSYLGETIGLGGAQRLIGQLQQLLRTLQCFGTGAQLTLTANTHTHTESHLLTRTYILFRQWDYYVPC